jgi:beta-glucosidase
VKIILLPILPNARATAKMADANLLITPMVDNETIFLFDLGAEMTPVGDSWQGLLPDRLHLDEEGYTMWAEGMEPLLVQLLTE